MSKRDGLLGFHARKATCLQSPASTGKHTRPQSQNLRFEI